jgi:hypothetical protein
MHRQECKFTAKQQEQTTNKAIFTVYIYIYMDEPPIHEVVLSIIQTLYRTDPELKKLRMRMLHADIVVYNTHKLYHSLTLLLLMKSAWEQLLQNTSDKPFREETKVDYTNLINLICDSLVTGPKWLFKQRMTGFPREENNSKIVVMGKGMKIDMSHVQRCSNKLNQAQSEGTRKSFNICFYNIDDQFEDIHREVLYSEGTSLDGYGYTTTLMPFVAILFWIRQILGNIFSNCCKVFTEEDQCCINPDMVQGLLDKFNQTVHPKVLTFITNHIRPEVPEATGLCFLMNNFMISLLPPSPCEAQQRLERFWFNAHNAKTCEDYQQHSSWTADSSNSAKRPKWME